MKSKQIDPGLRKTAGIMLTLLTLLALVSLVVTANAAAGGIKVTGPVPLKLYVFDCGEVLVRDLSLFNPALPKGVEKTLTDPCYLIKHPKGILFWDTGLPDSYIGKEGGYDVFDGAINLSVHKTLKGQLDEIGLDPAAVDYLVMSHLHNDHTGNAAYFKNATWLIQQSEYAIAFGDKAGEYGFHPDDYAALKHSKTMKLKGDDDVFGDGSVVIISAPGHSPGHQVLFADLPKTGPVILSGDLYHFKENRENYAIPVWNNKRESIHSFALVDQIIDVTHAALWIQHDKAQFDALKKAPAYYEKTLCSL